MRERDRLKPHMKSEWGPLPERASAQGRAVRTKAVEKSRNV
jgi:hypothetical protein